MIPYSNYQPTGFDVRGLNLPDRQDWLVAPCGVNRDSDVLTRSNWRVQARELDKLDPKGEDHEAHRFGHWACGWFELVLLRPGSVCATEAQGWEDALSDYPILDESDFSDLEWQEAHEVWQHLRYRERSALLAKHGLERRLARRAYPPADLPTEALTGA